MCKYKLIELSPSVFNEFVNSQPSNNFLQSIYAYRRYKSKSQEVYLLGLKKDGKLVLVALFVNIKSFFGKKVFSSPGGPVCDFNSENYKLNIKFFTKEIRNFFRKKEGLAVLVSPNVSYTEQNSVILKNNRFKKLGEYIQAKWIMKLSLSEKNENELFDSFRRTHRHNIRQASNRYGIQVRKLKKSELGILGSLAEKAAKKHGFTAQKTDYFCEMKDAFSDKAMFLCAFYKDRPVAAAMFIVYGNEVVYLYSGMDPDENRVYGSYAIQWYMLKWAIKHHFSSYNFLG